ncbi:MAG: hypothetical protein IT423_08805 [Pirellulaceae bacterium]|nr:hypothetical protein [Pirellulaceae bacterium]
MNRMAGGEVVNTDGLNAQVRRIAILVTSLDATAGRQLLMAMPSELARQVRRAMTQLTSIDPEEQRQILAEFRLQAMTANQAARHGSPNHDTSRTDTSRNDHIESDTARSDTVRSDAHDHQRDTRPSAMAPHYQPSDSTRHTRSGRDRWDDSNDQVDEGDAFRAHTAPPRDPSRSHASNTSSVADPHRPWQRLDVAALTDLLRGERALVIAVVISQLEPRQAAGLLEQLPRTQQRDVIANLSKLGQIDPEAMAAIDDHLALRISDYQHRRDSETESLGRIQDLLAAASPEMRGDWQTIIQETDQQLAHRLGLPPAHVRSAGVPVRGWVQEANRAVAPTRESQSEKTGQASRAMNQAAMNQSAMNQPAMNQPAMGRARMADLLANNVLTTADANLPPVGMDSLSHVVSSDSQDDSPVVLPFPGVSSRPVHTERNDLMRFEQILDLPADQIGQVLAAADSEVVLLALAGASPAFMKRFTSMLEKHDARALQVRLRQLRSINLQDVDEAQRRLCELASQLVMETRAAQSSLLNVAA